MVFPELKSSVKNTRIWDTLCFIMTAISPDCRDIKLAVKWSHCDSLYGLSQKLGEMKIFLPWQTHPTSSCQLPSNIPLNATWLRLQPATSSLTSSVFAQPFWIVRPEWGAEVVLLSHSLSLFMCAGDFLQIWEHFRKARLELATRQHFPLWSRPLWEQNIKYLA